ncbi:hypothetical protein [Crocosphaera chwakensis]|uniref:Uncharacterized protein n=1 Tax=Crocosphaera chwakensis CCY0110 TaxID=391612 RepID=A3IQI6_9CHRO|nr:hypothetical protein [Crocosphaera chwakensis]EAZ91261.1 hypothetical protein CY0110_11577 [Crocosphaera chwakensis CCY0110]
MKISNMTYLETVEANEVKGGFLSVDFGAPSAKGLADAFATSFGRGFSQSSTYTDTDSSADIGSKTSSATSQSGSWGEV